MPTLETPPNPAPLPPPQEETQPLKVRAGRFGELDHSELVHLLDSLDDDRSKSRFRESIYLSLFFYLAVAWFVFYGPKVLFHQGRLVSPADVLKQRDKELTFLEMPKDLKVPPPKNSKVISEHNAQQQTAHPTLDKKTLEELQKMRAAGNEGPKAPPAPRPLPEAPPPVAAQPQPQPVAPQPAQPRPQPTVAPNLPSAPAPAPTRPNFSTPSTAGQSIQDAAAAVARNRGGGGGGGGIGATPRHPGLQSGVEVLSDMQGVDFGPYLKQLKRLIIAQWYPLIPEECSPPLNKDGETLIRFTIQPNGVVSAMHLDGSTRDVAIDKAAWGGITGVGQLPPLPKEFHGDNLQLRINFVITHEGLQAE